VSGETFDKEKDSRGGGRRIGKVTSTKFYRLELGQMDHDFSFASGGGKQATRRLLITGEGGGPVDGHFAQLLLNSTAQYG